MSRSVLRSVAPKSVARALPPRKVMHQRQTKETDIKLRLNLDGTGQHDIATGIGFLDHMLEQLARHSLMDIALSAKGDLHVDAHHTTEDCGIVLGEGLDKALNERRGITRFANATIPMDEACTQVILDISGRPHLRWQVSFSRQKIGDMDTELFREWFQAFVLAAGLTLHVENLYGENNHHIIESCFKGLARALRIALAIEPRQAGRVPSTKEQIGKQRS